MRFFLNDASRKFLLLLTVVLFISKGLSGQAGMNRTNEYVPNRVIVKFKSGGDANEIVQFKAQLQTKLGVSKTRRWNKIDAEVWDFAGGDVQDIISRWKNDPRIKYIEPDYIVRASVVPNDPRYGDLWGMGKIQAAQAWDTTTGASVIVGVIDSGVDYLHPDLAPNIWTNTGETPGNGIDDDNNGYIDDVHGYDFINNDGDPMDDNNHGTHCSGTIAGVGDNGIGVVGINWTAKIMALKFLGASGFGNTSDAVSAVLYATAMGAKLTSNSWGGGGYSQALYDAINAAATANCLFVAAAGNDNSSFEEYPAAYTLDNVISIAATDINDARANFSNYGATWVDLGAPGVDILSTTRNNTYSSFNGTSMACPHVAGAAALIWARAPLLSWANVKDMILSSVDPVASLSGITVTGGRLNLFNAMVATGIYLRSADPVIAVSPPSVSFSILPDANSSSLLSISNTDVDAKKLDWNITSAPCSWLSINTLSGRVVGGGTQQIQFTANAFGMIPGNYQCTLNINSNDPVNPVVQVIVNLEVLYAPPPVASVSPPSISLALTIGQNADNIVTVSNIAGAGERNLHWSAAKQGSSAWLTLTNSSATTAAGASSEMHVLSDAAGLSAGVYNDAINITTNDPNNVLIQIPIQLTVNSEPVSGQKIYTFGGNANTIRRANLDGSNAATPFTGLTRPANGVVDEVNRKLYWADWNPMRIKRADLDGSNNETLVTSITGAIVAMDLDVANSHMYFFHQVAAQVYRLSRANLDGSNLITVGDVPGWNFSGLNIDHTNNKIYWYMLGASATGGHTETGIWRSNLDLTNKEHLVTPAADAGGGLSIDFAGGKMYWAETYPRDVIRTATLDGNNQADVLEGYEAMDVGIDPIHGKIYWTQQICVGFNCSYDTRRINLDGSNFESLGLDAYRLTLDLSGASQLTISDVTENEGHSGPATYSFTVSLSEPAGVGGVTFDIATQDNTATTANNDYVQKSLTDQTIPAGSSTYTFEVLVNGDNILEPDETFFVNITNVTGGIVSDGQGLGTITNDDLPCASYTNNRVYVNVSANGGDNGTSWTDAFTSLQSALAVANTCPITEIWVAEGTYRPGTLRTDFFAMKNNLAIYGGFPNSGNPAFGDRNADPLTNGTVLSGDIGTMGDNSDNSYHVLFNYYTAGTPLTNTAVLDGFTITGGYANGASPDCNGGGMYNVYASPTVRNCRFADNAVVRSSIGLESAGGAMYNSNSSPVVTNCVFSSNQARATTSAGHSYGAGMYNLSGSPVITNCTFNNNTTPNDDEDTFGGGMYNSNASPVISGCTFSANQAVFGGGIYNDASTIDITNCTFIGNTILTYPGGVNGGGINVRNSAGTISNCLFLNNAGAGAISVEVYSGNPVVNITQCVFNGNNYGIANQTAAPVVTNCLFVSNSFGGIVNWVGGNSSPNITNCTFSENPGSGLGSISNYGTSTATLLNCIIWGSGNSIYNPSGTVTISYSDIKQLSGVYAGTGNLNQDPLFVNGADPDGADNQWMTSDDGLALQTGSPAVNSGNATGAPATDILNNGRSGNTDMGAYELQCSAAVFSSCPSNQSVNAANNSCSNVVNYTATATGTPDPTITYAFSGATTGTGNGTGSGLSFNVGVTTVLLTATNSCGEAASCTFTITVVDAQDPSITCPANITQDNDANQCGAVVNFAATASDNCPGTSVSYSPASGSFFPVGTTTVTATATDAAERTSSCTFTVTVMDAQNPTITCPANITRDNDPNQCGAIVTFAAIASDNCPGVSVSYSPVSGSFFPAGTTTVTATATDAAGRTASCTFTVTVVDAQDPTVTCPANITQSLGSGSCSKQVATPNPTIGDNCGVAKLTWTMSGATTGASASTGMNYVGTKTFKAGTTTITYSATDAAGNTSSCSFTVQLKETVKPNITCPGDKSVHADPGLCYRSQLNLGNPSVSDNCGVASVTNDAPSVFPVGVTWVTWTVTDHSGNTRTCKQKITVEEHQNPTIECPAGITANTGASGCAVSITTPNPVYSDNCSVSKLTWTMTGATTGTSPTGGINFVGTRNFKPGVTIVKYTATDPSGNSRNCSFTVTVTDDQPPVVVCPPAQTRCKVSGNSYSIPAMTRSDNCGIASTKYIVTGATTRTGSGVNASGTFKLGTSTITWTVTDVNGNISTCSTIVTILPANSCGNNRVGEDVVDPKLITVGDGVFGVTAYPNPAEHYFNVRVNGSGQATVEIRMFDMQGKMVQQQRGAAGDTYRFGENLAAGMYIIEARQGTETVRIKVIKQ